MDIRTRFVDFARGVAIGLVLVLTVTVLTWSACVLSEYMGTYVPVIVMLSVPSAAFIVEYVFGR